MSWVAYDTWKLGQFKSAPVDFSSATLRIILLKSTYTPNRASDQFVSPDLGLGSNEVSGTNYSSGGNALSGVTATVSGHVVTVDSADLTIAQSGGGFSNARYAILIADTGSQATSPVIAYYDLGSNQGNTVSSLVLRTPTGLFTV